MAVAVVAALLTAAPDRRAGAQGVDASPFGFFFDGGADEEDFSDTATGDSLPGVVPGIGQPVGATPASPGGASAKPAAYQEPDFTAAIFDAAKLGLGADAQKGLARLLTAAAANFPDTPAVTNTVRAQALALAKRLDPLSPAVILANSKLKSNLKPEPVVGADVATVRSVADGIWKSAVALLDGATDDARKAGTYLVDLAATLDPADPFKAERRGRLAKAGVAPDWELVLATGTKAPAPAAAGAPPAIAGTAELRTLFLSVRKDGTTTGAIGTVTLSAHEGSGDGPPDLRVTGGNAALAKNAADAVRFLATARGNWPAGVTLTAKLGPWYRSHEADSAAVACAVLTDAVMRKRELDPVVAITGGTGGSGKVTEVRELANRLRGAKEAGAAVVGVPFDPNATTDEVADLCILGELDVLLGVQLVGLTTLDDATELAAAPSQRAPDLQKALALFAEIQQAVAGQDPAAIIKTAGVQSRLREVGQLAPNHLSARYLLLAAMNRPPAKLSFQGSRDALTAVAVPVGKVEGYGVTSDSVLIREPADICSQALFDLQDLRPKLHPATIDYCDSFSRYTEALKELSKTTNPNSARARTMSKLKDDAFQALKVAAERFRMIDKARFASS
jgi:hypothetical protein